MILRILLHLKFELLPPPILPARAPPLLELVFYPCSPQTGCGQAPVCGPRSAARGLRHVFEDVIKYHYDSTNKEFGTHFQPPQ